MNPERKYGLSDVILVSMDGKPMGEIQSIQLETKFESPKKEEVIVDGDNLIFRSMNQTIELMHVNLDQGFKQTLIDSTQRFDIVAEGYKLPRGKRLPKSKRLKKKWKKKYGKTIELKNCYFVNKK